VSKEGFNPSDYALRGRIGGFTKASRYSGAEGTKEARKAFMDRFDKLVDPEGKLPVEERTRRAEAARKAHMNELARRSAQARRK